MLVRKVSFLPLVLVTPPTISVVLGEGSARPDTHPEVQELFNLMKVGNYFFKP